MPDQVKPGSVKASIRGKRANSKIHRIAEAVERGDEHIIERGLVRLGKTNTRLMTGQEDLSTWSDEELRRGQRYDKNGRFQGAPPKVVPKMLHDELVKRTLSNAHSLLRDNLETAVAVLTEIVDDDRVEAKDRLRAVGMIMDRVMGKDPIPVNHTGETPPWQVAISAGIVSIKGVDLLGPDEDEGDDADE